MRSSIGSISVILISLFALSCTKSKNSNGAPSDSMSIVISDSGSAKTSKFIADTCAASDGTNGATRILTITGINFDSAYTIKEIYFEIYGYNGPGTYNLSNDSTKPVTATFDEAFPASTGYTIFPVYMTTGTIHITSQSANTVEGDFSIKDGITNYTGIFNIPY